MRLLFFFVSLSMALPAMSSAPVYAQGKEPFFGIITHSEALVKKPGYYGKRTPTFLQMWYALHPPGEETPGTPASRASRPPQKIPSQGGIGAVGGISKAPETLTPSSLTTADKDTPSATATDAGSAERMPATESFSGGIGAVGGAYTGGMAIRQDAHTADTGKRLSADQDTGAMDSRRGGGIGSVGGIGKIGIPHGR